jgi:hypothetical protein
LTRYEECVELLLGDVDLSEVHEIEDALQVLELDPAQVNQRLNKKEKHFSLRVILIPGKSVKPFLVILVFASKVGHYPLSKALQVLHLSMLKTFQNIYRKARIRHQCRKTTALSCYRCLINTGVEKMNNI